MGYTLGAIYSTNDSLALLQVHSGWFPQSLMGRRQRKLALQAKRRRLQEEEGLFKSRGYLQLSILPQLVSRKRGGEKKSGSGNVWC